MALRNEFESSGSWLFRHRSFLPLLLLPLFVWAFAGYTYLGQTHQVDELWNVGCLCVSLLGLLVRILTIGYAPVGTSGRNTRKQVAQTLNTTGMYSLVRHPLYLGNFLIYLGIVLYFHSTAFVLIACCVYALYYERIMFAEESYLRERFGETFEIWSALTPAFIPRFHGWQQPPLGFSWRTVLRREYTGFFGITAIFCVLVVTGDSLVEHRLRIDWPWVALFVLGGVTYVTLRTLKRHTGLLQAPGR